MIAGMFFVTEDSFKVISRIITLIIHILFVDGGEFNYINRISLPAI